MHLVGLIIRIFLYWILKIMFEMVFTLRVKLCLDSHVNYNLLWISMGEE